MKKISKVSVVGLGYIGLPTATIFASCGVETVGLDVNSDVVDIINSGQSHIVEPDLDVALHDAVVNRHLRATSVPEPAQAFIICVPTPITLDPLEPNLDYLMSAVKLIAPVLEKDNLIVLESTVPVGTTEKLCKWLSRERPDLSFPDTHHEFSDIRVAHCPERVLPGRVMKELVENDRLIGGLTKKCSVVAVDLYSVFVRGNCVITSSPRVAELAKLVENSFRDTNIAFANEISLVCDDLDIDVWETISVANLHPRVNILQPGPGVGGHCIAVDPWFIVASSSKATNLIRAARKVNMEKTKWVLRKFQETVNSLLSTAGVSEAQKISVAIYGLSFKPDIDDFRESPALEIAENIHREHCGPIFVYEPHISLLPSTLSNAELLPVGANKKADISIMLVDHSAFKYLSKPFGEVIDTRGVWGR